MKKDFYLEYNDSEICVTADYDIGYNGIGHYECHGAKGFDKGEPECEINYYTWDKKNKNAQEVAEIEGLLEENEEDLIAEIFDERNETADCRADELMDRRRDEGF